jgi:hypothetical protein
MPFEKAPAIIAQVLTAEDKMKEHWVTPKQAYLMVNIDTSFTKDGQVQAWGTVIRYHDCLIVCLDWDFLPHFQSAALEKLLMPRRTEDGTSNVLKQSDPRN